ncbi:AraC family transcriptional regulator [Paenibacillus oryzae]|nr:AraC family transcriptional regulator [Paenibacillus oryzae]
MAKLQTGTETLMQAPEGQNLAPAINEAAANGGHRYPFQLMKEQQHALEHVQADFRWGPYGICVFRFHLAAFPPGKIDRFHKHTEEYEFHFVPRGSGMVILEDTPCHVGEGMMYVTAPGVMHYQEADDKDGMDELCLRIRIVRIDDGEPAESWGAASEWREAEACVRQLGLIPRRPSHDRFKAMECFLAAYRAWYENQPGLLTVIRQCIIQILLRTTRAYFPEPEHMQLPSRDINRYRCRIAEQFIKDNYQEPLTLEAVAEVIHISPRQLQRIMKSQIGSTFSDYIESIRLDHVCRELAESRNTIDQVAVRNGFSSANYLHRVFKKKLGITPQQYRSRSCPGS